MKKWSVLIALATAATLAAVSPVPAIEKRDKESPPPPPKNQAVAKQDPKKMPDKAVVKKVTDTTRKGKEQPKKFDDFIDKNGNGIDDRIEEQKKP